MPDPRPALTRADVPAEITVEALRELPLDTLRRLADHRNGVLTRDEQQAFDRILHEVMRGTAERVSRRLSRAEWAGVRDEEGRRRRGPGRATSRVDEQVRRLARRIDEQAGVAETLAPGIDWSFARSGDEAPPDPAADAAAAPVEQDGGTVSDLEQRLTEQVELIEVMSEIAEVSKRTYALEQQRDLQTTRGVFFGLVVSLAVLVAGWAPLVTARDWGERTWMIGLTLGTAAVAGAVYWLVRRVQSRSVPADPDQGTD